jgi:hypothetical protein
MIFGGMDRMKNIDWYQVQIDWICTHCYTNNTVYLNSEFFLDNEDGHELFDCEECQKEHKVMGKVHLKAEANLDNKTHKS